MNQTKSASSLSRRRFLKRLAAGGIIIAGGYALSEYTPWLDYEGQAQQTIRSFVKESIMPKQMLELIRYATLAANSHNSQPWKFAVNENTIEIHPDYARRLPVVDPQDRELWISLGCALENLLTAARANGYASDVIYPNEADHIEVRLTEDAPQSSPLFDAIPLRQNTRSKYNGLPVKRDDFDQIQAVSVEPGVKLHFVTNSSELETVVNYVNQGNLNQYANTAFVNELIHWLRFNKKEALSSLDGLYSRCSGNPEVPRWFGKIFVSGTKPQQQADADAQKLRSSSGAVVIASESDDKAVLVRTGQVYERLALKMTSLNVKSAFLNQPIEETNVRSQFQSATGLGAFTPQLLVRFGYAETMPHSLRRPAEQVLL